MRAYELTFAVDGVPKSQFADTQKDARDRRRSIMEANGLKFADVAITQVEIPTKKEELLAWLNGKIV